jgi:hypothetical protein
MPCIFDMPWQAAVPHGIQSVLQNRFISQPRIQLLSGPTRRNKALTTPRSQD